MLKNKNRLMLEEGYDFYKSVHEKTKKLSSKVFKECNSSILEQWLYNLVINLCNQVIYNYKYIFSKLDLFIIADYNINIARILDNFKIDIIKMKKSL